MTFSNHLNRSLMLVSHCWLSLVSMTTPACAETQQRMNVVVLYADDMRHDVLGVAGHPVIKTPVLDGLASQGVRFTRHYVTTSICGASRATLYTGQWLSRHQSGNFGMWTTPWAETYPGLTRDEGYFVGHVGKWHNGKFDASRYDFAREYAFKHWFEVDGQRVHVTQRNQQDAMAFLKARPADKPFVLTVCFFAPHAEDRNVDQYLPQPKSTELYQDADIPVPENATDESWGRLPDLFDEQNEGRNRYRWRFDEPDKYQRMMKNYYRLISEIDATTGVILDELKRQGVLDQTLVIFTADNGYFHGEHGLADKWYPYEESIRVPLIVWDPRLPEAKRGTTQSRMTLSVDVAPTVLDATGIEPPAGMQGLNLAPLYLEDKTPEPWRTEYFYEHLTVRDKDFIPASQALVRINEKYIYWPEYDVEQLFDLTTDPHEEHDLAGDPRHAEKLESMRARFGELKAAAE